MRTKIYVKNRAMHEARVQIAKSRNILRPHAYVRMLLEDYSQWALDEERAPQFKGGWREKVFSAPASVPLDLEIGTGIGLFFAHHALKNPHRCVVGIEVKYKPLIQAIKRALRNGSVNARMARYAGQHIDELFADGELDDVYIHHPDPWLLPKKHKHRLVRKALFDKLWRLQKPGSKIEFKTDSREYFLWAMEQVKETPYVVERYTLDLHHSEWAGEQPLLTQFEKIFVNQQIPINYAWLRKPVDAKIP